MLASVYGIIIRAILTRILCCDNERYGLDVLYTIRKKEHICVIEREESVHNGRQLCYTTTKLCYSILHSRRGFASYSILENLRGEFPYQFSKILFPKFLVNFRVAEISNKKALFTNYIFHRIYQRGLLSSTLAETRYVRINQWYSTVQPKVA